MIITKNKTILGVFDKEEYASIVYQILYDAELEEELVQEILLFPQEINFKTIKYKW